MQQNKFDKSINNIYVKAASKVALAISGGIDSTALLYLFSDFAKRNQIQITIFSVNHNLRSEAIDEIKFVKKHVENLGHDFYALNWEPEGNDKSGIQERAREARYRLMTDKCHALGISILLTAHHKDDLLETYIMRKRKKSGILGLSYSPSFFYNDIQIYRPLLIFYKKDLIDFLRSKKIGWKEDSSNSSDDYERNRIRKEIASFPNDTKESLFQEMEHINKQAKILNRRLLETIAETVQISTFGYAIIDLGKLKLESGDIKIQILNYILTVIGGKTTVPRFRKVTEILTLLNLGKKIDRSLHGCIMKSFNHCLLIYREKQDIDNNLIRTNNGLLWDDRFLFEKDDLKPHYKVETLDISQYRELKKYINIENTLKRVGINHKPILFTLPVIKNLEKIIAIPHISYYDRVEFKGEIRFKFAPNFISRFTHFL